MFRFLFINILTFCCVIASGSSSIETDYCSPTLCSAGRQHIGCNNTGAFSPKCPAGQTEMVTMTKELIEGILSNHNSKRHLIASGGLGEFLPAVKMSLMQWNDELAYLAELNVKRCTLQHDTCHNTNNFKPSGQNLAKMWWKGGSYTDQSIILSRIDTWWLEYKNTNMSQISAYPKYTDKMIGHFTVMTAEDNTCVGCSAIKYPENGFSSMTFACNYASTNFIGMPMYKPGPTASLCKFGTSRDFPSLCL